MASAVIVPSILIQTPKTTHEELLGEATFANIHDNSLVPYLKNVPPASFSWSQDQLHLKRRRRRRHISEVLRLEGHKIGELTEEMKKLQEIEVNLSSTAVTAPLHGLRQFSNVCNTDTDNHNTKSRFTTSSDGSMLSTIRQELFASTLKVSGRERFRRAVRKVINGRFWMNGSYSSQTNLRTYMGPGQHQGEKEILCFNVNAFRPDMQAYDSLSTRAKMILMYPSWLRTEDEIKYLTRYTMRLKCFEKCSTAMRKELARVIYYEKIEKDHVVIRQGDVGLTLHFIVSGSVLVEVEETDKNGRKVTMIVNQISSGGTFGEVALMQDGRHTATVICNNETEFLKVDREAYREMLTKSQSIEWENRTKLIKIHPLFRGFSTANLLKVVEGSNIEEYERDSVIMKDLSLPSSRVHFIVKGCCMVVQKIKLWEKAQYYHSDNFMFPMSAETRDSNKSSHSFKNYKLVGDKVYRLITKWWIVRTLKEGEYFGLGEGNEGMSIICDQNVVILTINRMVFRHHNRGHDLARLQTEAMGWYPPNKEILASYIDWKRWIQYKRNVGLEILGMKHERESTENYMLDV